MEQSWRENTHNDPEVFKGASRDGCVSSTGTQAVASVYDILSMEFISVVHQRQVYQRQLDIDLTLRKTADSSMKHLSALIQAYGIISINKT